MEFIKLRICFNTIIQLLIESLPNLSTAKALSVSANLGINPAAAFPISSIGGTFQKANGSYAGVEQQSGIYAGSGGFDIAVKGNAKLKGALIESTAAADKNYLSAKTLAFENIAVHSTYSAMSFAGQISATGAPSFAPPQFANSNEKARCGRRCLLQPSTSPVGRCRRRIFRTCAAIR